MKVLQSIPQREYPDVPLRRVRQVPARVALHLSEGVVLLAWQDILYCTADGNYTHILATGGRHYVLSKTLKRVVPKLPVTRFFRIHQSHLVNMEAIASVTRDEVRMIDQATLPLARAKRKTFFERLEQITITL